MYEAGTHVAEYVQHGGRRWQPPHWAGAGELGAYGAAESGFGSLREQGRLVPMPTVTDVRFRNTGTSDPDNCCAVCPVTLGVGRSGTGSNGMELRFTISGHRAGIEYDIVRTRRNSLWQRRAGVWTRIEANPMGTRDDHHDRDECLRPRNNRLFVIDTPGFPAALPQPAGTIFAGLTGATTDANATDIVVRFSFAEWVIARHRGEGVAWTPLRPRRFIFWHSITWLVRNGVGQWVLSAARSEIARGALSAATINATPVT